jgi:hypothetical protein
MSELQKVRKVSKIGANLWVDKTHGTHYLAPIDRYVVMERGRVDKTRDILKRLRDHRVVYYGGDIITEAADEIDRLRSEIANDVIFKALRERIEELGRTRAREAKVDVARCKMIDELTNRIEGLEGEADELEGSIEGLLETIKMYKKRIEELEKEREECINQCPAPTIAQAAAMTHGEKLYIVTDKQIDAAWRHAAEVYYVWQGEVYATMEKLGIVQCEECEGRGDREPSEIYTQGGDPMDPTPIKCPDCDGHGWDKGDI